MGRGCSGTSVHHRESLWGENVKTVEHRKRMLGLKDSGENVRCRHVCNMSLSSVSPAVDCCGSV